METDGWKKKKKRTETEREGTHGGDFEVKEKEGEK